MRTYTYRARALSLIMVVCLSLSISAQEVAQRPPASARSRDGFARANARVLAIIEHEGVVYIGGQFNRVGPDHGGLVALDATSGEIEPGLPCFRGVVNAMAEDGRGGWIVGGLFQAPIAGGPENLARVRDDLMIDPDWHPDPDGEVQHLARLGGTLYVSGAFNRIGAEPRPHLAAVDLATGRVSSWLPRTTNLHSVGNMVATDDAVVVTAQFDGDPRGGAWGLGAFNPRTGAAIKLHDTPNRACTLAAHDHIIYLGGQFSKVGKRSRSLLAALDTRTGRVTGWNPGPRQRECNSGAHLLRCLDGQIYVEGLIHLTDTGQALLDANQGRLIHDPMLEPAGFHPLVSDGRHWLGSYYTNGWESLSPAQVAIGDRRTGKVARLGPVFDGVPTALGLVGNRLLVGGRFGGVGGEARPGLAALDARTGRLLPWNPALPSAGGQLGSETHVSLLVLAGSRLIIAGSFGTSSKSEDFLQALELPSGRPLWMARLTGHVAAMAGTAERVFVAGRLESINSQPRGHVAALDLRTGELLPWNPSFSASGGSPFVGSLAVAGNSLFVAGSFDRVDGQAQTNLAAFAISSGALKPWRVNPIVHYAGLASVNRQVLAWGARRQPSAGVLPWQVLVDPESGATSEWNPQFDPTLGFRRLTGVVAVGKTLMVLARLGPEWHELALSSTERTSSVVLRALDLSTGHPHYSWPTLQWPNYYTVYPGPTAMAVDQDSLYLGGAPGLDPYNPSGFLAFPRPDAH